MEDERISDFDTYYDSLKSQVSGGGEVSELNHNRIHNAAIMKLMLDNGGSISMYCGSMSVFRNDFYDDIARENNNTELARDVKEKVGRSLHDFLNKQGNCLSVVMENACPNLLSDLIVDSTVAENAIAKDRLKLSRIKDDFLWRKELTHFCCSSKPACIRTETDKDSHEGVFIGNSPEIVNFALNHFKELGEYSVGL